MKATGIIRNIDELGRIVLPKELRRSMEINERDALEIFTENDSIILKKYQPACIFCENMDDVILFHNKRVCRKCMNAMKEL